MRTLILTLLIFGMVGQGHGQDDSIHQQLQAGIRLHDAGDYTGAIAKYDAIIALHPDYFNAYYEKTYSLISAGKYQESVELCRRILKEFPDNAGNGRVYDNYGSALDALGQPAEAIRIYEEGIRKFPDFYLLPFNKGITEGQQNQMDAAVKDFEAAIGLNRGHASSHQSLAYCVYTKNKMGAVMALATFLLLEPSGARAEKNVKLMGQIMGANVEKKDDKTVNITVSGLPSDKDTLEDDFRSTEVFVSMQAALVASNNRKYMDPVANFKGILDVLLMRKPAKCGFFTNTYFALFDDLKKEGLIETAVHVIYTSADIKDNNRWLEHHQDKVNLLSTWMGAWVKRD